MLEVNEKDIPQLIVGLDSLDEDANYIHIVNAKDDVDYYCPCCKGMIKPRAYRKGIKYEVQPHFYHVSGGCTEESYVHYICKNWLFDTGCNFIANGTNYVVDSVEVEKTLHTAFGDYRPDIIVTTTSGKVFYFEIKVTNQKSELLAPKWDELGNDVVEVDTRYFINQKNNCQVPEFELIYSDGVCHIKKYTRMDYDSTIAKRKIEWKRKDVLNYKIQWERLDWFWTSLADYSTGDISEDDVLNFFSQLDYEDKEWCYQTIKTKSCVQLKKQFKEYLAKGFRDYLKNIGNDFEISIDFYHKSPLIYMVTFRKYFQFEDYNLHDFEEIKLKMSNGVYLGSENKSKIMKCFVRINDAMKHSNKMLKRIKHVSTLDFVKSIYPVSHYASTNYPFKNLEFKIIYQDYIHNRYVKEEIGYDIMKPPMISERHVTKMYIETKNERIKKMDEEFFTEIYKRNSKLTKVIESINNACFESGMKYLRLYISENYESFVLLNGNDEICNYVLSPTNEMGFFEDYVEELFLQYINNYSAKYRTISEFCYIVNNCKNGLWEMKCKKDGCFYLSLFNPKSKENMLSRRMDLYNATDVKKCIEDTMNDMFDHMQMCGIRFMEVK